MAKKRQMSIIIHRPLFHSSLFLTLFLFLFSSLSAQNLSGTVRAASDRAPLPFAPISVKGTTQGTVTNEKGEFLLRLPVGKYTLVVKYLGYKTQEYEISIPGQPKWDFMLEEEDLSLPDVLITGDGEDPAYGIIRRAIERRELNDMPFESWTYDQYSRTTVRYVAKRDSGIPDFLSRAIVSSETDSVGAPEKGITYLEENQSKIGFKRPDQKKEKITSSRISGNREDFGYISNLFLRYLDFTPYRSFLSLGELAE